MWLCEVIVVGLLFEMPWTVMQRPIFARKAIRKLSEGMVQMKTVKMSTGKFFHLHNHSAL